MTINKAVVTAILIGLAVPSVYADFTYESTTRITGGALVGMMKMAGTFSKDARKTMDPIASTTSIKGNRMLHKTADSASIIDLDKETITHVDYARKTYSVMTFAQMKEAMDEMQQKMQQQTQQKGGSGQSQVNAQFDMKLNDTGNTKTINGNSAHEVIMTFTMQGADAQSGAKGGMDMVTDMWIAPRVAGYDQVREFQKRMSRKIAWMPGSNPMLNRPDMQRAMAEMYKEGSKMDGMPVYETIKMGGKIEGMPDSSQGQQQQQSSRNSSPPPTSVSDALGSALGGRLGGFGRKKKDTQADSNSTSQPSSADSNSASGSLMEMTMEVTNYSSAPADPASFEVPVGFNQVQEDPMHPNRRQR